MNNWTEGYVIDVNYTYHFFQELNPSLIAFALLSNGYYAPSLKKFTYCELGCGHGFSTNILAASNPQGEFWAMDFNPSQMAEAQKLANEAKITNIHFSDQSFEEFLETDTPPFDFITLHGVYSWISAANRHIIVEILRRKLNFGGVVYISYNTLPGWSAMMPLRELMVQYGESCFGSTLERIEKGIAFADKIKQLKAQYFLSNQDASNKLEEIKTESRNYLAHEYFNKDWHSFYHSEVANHLSAAKLTFATSLNLTDQILNNIALSDEALKLLREISNPSLAETVRDFFFNRVFRKDIFVKGPVKLTPQQKIDLLSDLPFILTVPPENIQYELQLAKGKIKLQKEIYQPLIEELNAHTPTFKELLPKFSQKENGFAEILQALSILISKGYAMPALPFSIQNDQRKINTSHINAAILKQVELGLELKSLASPVIGSGIDINLLELMFLIAHQRNLDPVSFAWECMKIKGVKLLNKDGKKINTIEETKIELHKRAKEFFNSSLPTLKRLEVI